MLPVQKLLYMCDQIRTTAYSRKEQVTGDRGGVRKDINYGLRVTKGDLWEAICSGPDPAHRTGIIS